MTNVMHATCRRFALKGLAEMPQRVYAHFLVMNRETLLLRRARVRFKRPAVKPRVYAFSAVDRHSVMRVLTDALQRGTMHFMEDQLTIRLPRELNVAMKERAARMNRKPSEIVRMAVAEFLRVDDHPAEPPAQRVRDLIGSLRTGIPDLAVRHRQYLTKKLRRGR